MKEMKDTCISLWSNALSGSPYQDSTTYASKLAAGLKQPVQQQTQRPRRARETDGSNRPLPQPQQPATRQTEDLRIYIRLDECSPAWTKSPMTIRLMIAQALDLPAKTVPQAWLVKTGWAVRPADLITHAKILEAEPRLTALLGAEKIEISQKWHTYVVKGCPRTIQDHLGQPIELEALIEDEAKIQTGYEPTSWRLSQHTQPEDHLITVLISFLRPLRTRFTLFGISQPAQLVTKKNPPTQCDNCWGYHPRRYCTRTARCWLCGQAAHSDTTCDHDQPCANCLAPHTADDPKCLARPKREHGRLVRITRKEYQKLRLNNQRNQARQDSQARTTPSPSTRSLTIPLSPTLAVLARRTGEVIPALSLQSLKKRRLEGSTAIHITS